MISTNSPLESLASFAIVLVVSVLSTIAFGKYIDKIKRDAERSVK